MNFSSEEVGELLDMIAQDYTWDELRNLDLMYSILKHYLGLDESCIGEILRGAVQIKWLNDRRQQSIPKLRVH